MLDEEIIQKWKQGLSKNKLAIIYKREYNMHIRNIRANVKHRHSGKMITNYEALKHIEEILYKYLKDIRK